MRGRDYVLLAGAVAAGLRGVDQRVLNPTLANLLMCLGLALAWWAQHPRDEHARQHTPALNAQEIARLAAEKTHWESEGGSPR
jgi:hypothetical protein